MEIIDLTHKIKNNMPIYEGDKETKLTEYKNITYDGYSSFFLETGFHVGTHIDSVMHLVDNKETIDTINLDKFIGKGILINAENKKTISYEDKYEDSIKEDDIVLIYTGFSDYFYDKNYFKNHPVINKEMSDFFIYKKIKMLGIDFPSPDKYPYILHKNLLENNIFILENLTNLSLLINKNFYIHAVPLKIEAEASLVRAYAVIQ